MTIEEKNELHRLLNGINKALTDAHLKVEDRLDLGTPFYCIDDEMTPVYTEIAELKLIIEGMSS